MSEYDESEYITNPSKEAVEVLRRIDEFWDEPSGYREESFVVANYVANEIAREIDQWGVDEYHYYRGVEPDGYLREEYVFYCRHGGNCVIRVIFIMVEGGNYKIIVRKEPR